MSAPTRSIYQSLFGGSLAEALTLASGSTIGSGGTITSPTITSPTISSPAITTQPTLGIGASTAAAGTTTSDATGLPAGTAPVYPTTAADGTKGVKIDVSDQVTGRLIFIGNEAAAVLKVYGPTGAVINGGSADAAFSSVSGKGVIAVCLSGSGNTWLMW